ncbi:MAG TPA: CDGSH iron-sulfur domain-containing protein [Planctomycetota bacterium]|nr:CDGSH iron-sulfur domain-containing protein [Planctomycetota bacterium]
MAKNTSPEVPPAASNAKIVVSKNGPYVVTGAVPIEIQSITPNKEGFSWEWTPGRSFPTQEEVHLCRCGQSKKKPFCDGSHVQARWDPAETAERTPYERQAEKTEGPGLTLQDAEELCAFARFCDPAGKIWGLIDQTDNPEARALAIREAQHCPGGRLVVREKTTGKPLEPNLPPSIGLVEDPALQCSGPLWVRGGIPVVSADGTPYEARNRVTLCRCGVSSNKPFCNGAHASIKFRDGLT